jgi:hypothetical protein
MTSNEMELDSGAMGEASKRMEFRLKAESLKCAAFRLKAELHAPAPL